MLSERAELQRFGTQAAARANPAVAMSRFRVTPKAGGSVPAAAAAAAAAPAEPSLASIAGTDPLPIRPVSTRGRIVFLFGVQDRYPQQKQAGWIESFLKGLATRSHPE